MDYRLTDEGRKYLENGLPELNLLKRLEKGSIQMKEASETENFSIALMWAKKNGWVDIKNGMLVLKKKPSGYGIEDSLKKISNGEAIGPDITALLLQRNLITEEKEDAHSRAEKYRGTEISSLNEDIIKTGAWKDVKFRPYNAAAPGKKMYPGKLHHYGSFLQGVKLKLISLGFKEMSGPVVETEFWNMDALYMPQHHSARDIHDAYFLKEPRYARSLDKNILNSVKNSHEKGSDGSRGWEYQYDIKRAHRLILRTQGTALSARTLASHPKVPGKYFSISRCFRCDVVDATHLPDFYQLEGIVIDKSLSIRHLIGLLKMFAKEFANTEKIKVSPGYFPFTEPSMELFARHPDLGWVELGGAGIFRKELTAPLGIKEPVIAWGLGIDRIGMFNLGINDIRELFSQDLKYLRNSPVIY